ncbi:MAG: type VI secretion system-associated protein TagO [Nitratireductor sp.]
MQRPLSFILKPTLLIFALAGMHIAPSKALAKTSCFAKSFYQGNTANCSKTKSMHSIYSKTPTRSVKKKGANFAKRNNNNTIRLLQKKQFPNLMQISGGQLSHAITIQSSAISANAAKVAQLPTSAALHIRCINNKTSVLFDFPDTMVSAKGNTRATAEVLYALDKGKDHLLGLSISNESNILGLWNGNAAVPFTKKLFGKSELKLNAWNPQGVESIYRFNISNLETAIVDLRNACNW